MRANFFSVLILTIGLVIGLFMIQVLVKITAMAMKSSWIMCGTLLAGYEPQRFVKFATNGSRLAVYER